MTNRENVLRALRREEPARVPFEFSLCPAKTTEFKSRTGMDDYLAYYGIPLRTLELRPTRRVVEYSGYYEHLPADASPLAWNPEWGVMGVPGSTAHFQKMLHPMARFESAAEINAYPFPDLADDYRWEGLAERVQDLAARDQIAIAPMQMTLFETAWYLRGMDNFLTDLSLDPEFAAVLLDKILEIRLAMAERYAGCGVDLLMLGDDVATQREMMLGPAMWRSVFKPRLAGIIAAAKNIKRDLLVFYHGDGNLRQIIPDLIEIGVDILNPVQPECMEPAELKRLYGDRLSFWGALGTQTTLPFGTAAEVRETCRRLKATMGSGGGFLLAPTHVIEPEVPWENLEAFIETMRE